MYHFWFQVCNIEVLEFLLHRLYALFTIQSIFLKYQVDIPLTFPS
jgi:hypothetical protein